eukprot:TRINITY_DN1330_c0_g1_i1.p1 TRINITY_DN1330_c0_g1~~TRINITY_DN1330_c0_g1_i1.p1  ORF type:complete len:1303 (-),score=348.99 TRINITY_DN1330_c0_g1_i1:63-3971(-)
MEQVVSSIDLVSSRGKAVVVSTPPTSELFKGLQAIVVREFGIPPASQRILTKDGVRVDEKNSSSAKDSTSFFIFDLRDLELSISKIRPEVIDDVEMKLPLRNNNYSTALDALPNTRDQYESDLATLKVVANATEERLRRCEISFIEQQRQVAALKVAYKSLERVTKRNFPQFEKWVQYAEKLHAQNISLLNIDETYQRLAKVPLHGEIQTARLRTLADVISKHDAKTVYKFCSDAEARLVSKMEELQLQANSVKAKTKALQNAPSPMTFSQKDLDIGSARVAELKVAIRTVEKNLATVTAMLKGEQREEAGLLMSMNAEHQQFIPVALAIDTESITLQQRCRDASTKLRLHVVQELQNVSDLQVQLTTELQNNINKFKTNLDLQTNHMKKVIRISSLDGSYAAVIKEMKRRRVWGLLLRDDMRNLEGCVEGVINEEIARRRQFIRTNPDFPKQLFPGIGDDLPTPVIALDDFDVLLPSSLVHGSPFFADEGRGRKSMRGSHSQSHSHSHSQSHGPAWDTHTDIYTSVVTDMPQYRVLLKEWKMMKSSLTKSRSHRNSAPSSSSPSSTSTSSALPLSSTGAPGTLSTMTQSVSRVELEGQGQALKALREELAAEKEKVASVEAQLEALKASTSADVGKLQAKVKQLEVEKEEAFTSRSDAVLEVENVKTELTAIVKAKKEQDLALAETTTKLDIIATKLSQKEDSLVKASAKCKAYEKSLAVSEEANEALREELEVASTVASKATRRNSANNQRIRTLETELATYSGGVETTTTALSEKTAEVLELEEKLAAEMVEKESLEQKLLDALASGESALDALRAEFGELLARNTSAESEIETLSNEISSLKEAIVDMESQVSTLKQNNLSLETLNGEAEQSVSKLQKELAKCNQQLAQSQQEEEALTKTVENLADKLEQLTQRSLALNSDKMTESLRIQVANKEAEFEIYKTESESTTRMLLDQLEQSRADSLSLSESSNPPIPQLEQENAALSLQKTQLRKELESLQEKVEEEKEKNTRMVNQMEMALKEVETLRAVVQENETNLASSHAAVQQLTTYFNTLEKELEAERASSLATTNTLDLERAKIVQKEVEITQLNQNITNLNAELQLHKNDALALSQVQIGSLEESLREEYDMDKRKFDRDRAVLVATIHENENRCRELNTVNNDLLMEVATLKERITIFNEISPGSDPLALLEAVGRRLQAAVSVRNFVAGQLVLLIQYRPKKYKLVVARENLSTSLEKSMSLPPSDDDDDFDVHYKLDPASIEAFLDHDELLILAKVVFISNPSPNTKSVLVTNANVRLRL